MNEKFTPSAEVRTWPTRVLGRIAEIAFLGVIAATDKIVPPQIDKPMSDYEAKRIRDDH